MSDDPFDLARFVTAQEGVIERALAELHAGRKTTHWMWFVFPQLRGLGVSPTAQFYGLTSLDEAKAYLAHPLLGYRLRRSVDAVLGVKERTLHEIFGSPDDLKFGSSMTLFELAAGGANERFGEAIERFCDSRRDERTVELVGDDAR